MDLATRLVVGWQTVAHMRTALVTDALQMAIDAGHVTHGAIFHSNSEYSIRVRRVRLVQR